MGGRLRILVCLVVGALSLLAAGPALAQGGGTTTSAGDQQYVDPLSTSTSTTPKPSTTTTSTTPSPSSSGTPTSASPPATTSSSTTTPQSSAANGNTLPYTGLNLGLVIAVALGLIGAGLLIRRLVRRA